MGFLRKDFYVRKWFVDSKCSTVCDGFKDHSLYYQVLLANNWKSKWTSEVWKQVRGLKPRENQHFMYVFLPNPVLIGIMVCDSVVAGLLNCCSEKNETSVDCSVSFKWACMVQICFLVLDWWNKCWIPAAWEAVLSVTPQEVTGLQILDHKIKTVQADLYRW